MFFIFLIPAIIAALAGAVNLSPATLGVGLVGLACFLAILARMIQK